MKSKAAASQADNPNWHQAMNSQFSDEYWEAAVTEIEALESINEWEVADSEDDMNVINST